MSSNLCIQLSSDTRADSFEVKFFESDGWTSDAERQLMARIQETLSLLRNLAKSFQVTISADVTDFDQSAFILLKKTNQVAEIKDRKLSLREVEVLGLIMDGYTNQEIAAKLFISYETVRSHRKNILEKSGAKNTASLINYFHQTFFEK